MSEREAYMQYLRAEWINYLKEEGLTQKRFLKKHKSFLGYSRTSKGDSLKMDAAIEIRDQQITNIISKKH